MPDPNNVALADHGVVFMLLPKIANTSIKRAILAGLGKRVDNVHDPKHLDYVSKDRARHFPTRIAVVRDPLTRLRSCHHDKFVAQSDGEFLPGFRRLGLAPEMDFGEFVEAVSCLPDSRCQGAGQHFRSMAYDLVEGSRPGGIIPNHIFRFERLADEWPRLRALVRRAGFELPELLPRHKGPATPPEPPAARALALALQRYRDDIRLFGYAPERKYRIDPARTDIRGRSICNVHREAYRLADQVGDDEVREHLKGLIAEAFDMGKRMNARLRQVGQAQYIDE